mgnify:CR=1 FL=1
MAAVPYIQKAGFLTKNAKIQSSGKTLLKMLY